jgi:hypothetical protein
LEDLGVDARKAILWTLCAGLLVIVYAMAFPKTAGCTKLATCSPRNGPA